MLPPRTGAPHRGCTKRIGKLLSPSPPLAARSPIGSAWHAAVYEVAPPLPLHLARLKIEKHHQQHRQHRDDPGELAFRRRPQAKHDAGEQKQEHVRHVPDSNRSRVTEDAGNVKGSASVSPSARSVASGPRVTWVVSSGHRRHERTTLGRRGALASRSVGERSLSGLALTTSSSSAPSRV